MSFAISVLGANIWWITYFVLMMFFGTILMRIYAPDELKAILKIVKNDEEYNPEEDGAGYSDIVLCVVIFYIGWFVSIASIAGYYLCKMFLVVIKYVFFRSVAIFDKMIPQFKIVKE